MYICVYHGLSERALDPLELELMTVVSYHIDMGELSPGPLEEHPEC